MEGRGLSKGRFTLSAHEVHQDVDHDDGASASDAGAVGTDQVTCGEFTERSRGPARGCTCSARVALPRLGSHLRRVAPSPPRHAPTRTCSAPL